MAAARRVEIGLGIGQVVSARLDDGGLADLRKAVEAGEGWHEIITTDEGILVINVKTVVFIRIPDQQQSIGFSSSA
jgi:hypothetical protein